VIRKFSDPPLEACPTCGRPIQKLMSAPAIQFKGTGWYITDYARKSTGKEAGKGGEAKGGESKSGEGKSGEGAAASGAKDGASSKDTSKSDSGTKAASGGGSGPKGSTGGSAA
jgi:predicted nucleic acid-binding Zn ribbon protein